MARRKLARDYLSFHLRALAVHDDSVVMESPLGRKVILPRRQVFKYRQLPNGLHLVVLQRWLAQDRGIEGETVTPGN